MTDMKKVVPFYYSSNGNTEEDKKFLEPVEYSFQCSEKHLYKKIPYIFNYWFKLSPDKYQRVDEIIQMAFNICILFDDVQDDAVFRDGFPVTHTVYGLHNSINAATYLIFITVEKCMNLHPMAVKVFIEEFVEYFKGQGMDIYWKENFIRPTEKEYSILAHRKCGWVLGLTTRLMKLFSTYDEDVSLLTSSLELFYQIQDDYCNLRQKENNDNNSKSYCDDLTEGKISFLIMHALKNNPDDKIIINILKKRTQNIEIKRYCVKILENYGSFKYTKDVLDELYKKMRTEIDRLGGNPLFVEFVDEFKNKMLKTRV